MHRTAGLHPGTCPLKNRAIQSPQQRPILALLVDIPRVVPGENSHWNLTAAQPSTTAPECLRRSSSSEDDSSSNPLPRNGKRPLIAVM